MSEHITHVAVFEDCTRILLQNKDRFPSVFSKALSQYYEYGLVSCGTRGNAVFAVPIVEKYRGSAASDAALGHISGSLGWISHRAADAQLNFLADRIDEENNPFYTGQDLKLYYDAVVVNYVYEKGKRSSESENEVISEATLSEGMHTNPASAGFDMRQFEWLYVNHYMRDILELQQFNKTSVPDGELADFLTLHDSRSQYYGENLPKYEQAFENPDPYMMTAFDHRLNFYDPNDPLIRYTRAIQHGESSEVDLDEALNDAVTQSHYARSLRLNYDYWSALGKFWEDSISKNALKTVLDKRYA